MACAGEHVYRSSLFHGIAEGEKPRAVPREGCGVAGNVNDPLWLHARGDCFEQLGGAALAGRVQNHHVRRDILPGKEGGGAGCIAAQKACVADPVARGVALCVFYRLGNDLHADDFLRPARHRKADHTRAAVKVQNRFPPGEGGAVRCEAVKAFGLRAVDLVKGERGKLDGKAAEGIGDCIGAIEGAAGFPKHHVGLFRVAVDNKAFELRNLFAEP